MPQLWVKADIWLRCRITSSINSCPYSLELQHTVSCRTLTSDLQLVGCAGRTGQQCKLFSLVHWVVCTGHHHPIPRPPACRLVSQLQDAAVWHHVDGNRGLWTNYRVRWKESGHKKCSNADTPILLCNKYSHHNNCASQVCQSSGQSEKRGSEIHIHVYIQDLQKTWRLISSLEVEVTEISYRVTAFKRLS